MLDNGSIHNNQAKQYDKEISKDLNDYLRENYFQTLDRVTALAEINKGMKVLDIGVGTGLLTERLPKGSLNFGIDISEKMLKKAEGKNLPIKLVKGNFLNIPFKNNKIHRIISTFALHHLSPIEKQKAFKEMDRVLLGDGIIVIGDFMFKDENQKNEVIKKFKEENRNDMLLELEDEYFMNIRKIEKYLNGLSYNVTYERASVLSWIFKAKKCRLYKFKA
ncbi:MAG: class I SAM-dependent methyltransferase [candidate division WOR-3 bacterium]